MMPWSQRDAYRHTSKASTPHLQRQWAQIANSVLEQTGDDARAIREANAVIARGSGSKQKRKKET